MRRSVTARRLATVVVGVALGCATVACGSDALVSDAAGTTAPAVANPLPLDDAADLTGSTEVAITVQDNVFEPKVFHVDAGAVITFTNEGNNSHNVIPTEDGAFEPIVTGSLDPGASATIELGKPGIYPFYCSIHGSPNRGQRGVVIVGDVPTG